MRSMVIPAASTGRDPMSSIAVMIRDQGNSGTRSIIMASVRMFQTVTTKLIEATMEDAPARWREKMARSTAALLWATFLDRGGYTVHPVATPPSTIDEARRSISAIGRSQNLRLFRRGKAMSGAEIISGISQFPKPPIKTGITRKKIIRNA